MNASPSPEIPVPLDENGSRLLKIAALIGAQVEDDVFISYTVLLVGVLFAQSNPPAKWQAEARNALRLDAILNSKPGLSAWRGDSDADWPAGRPLLSVSARNVLGDAYGNAIGSRGKDALVAPADIMASFLSNVPPAHQKQAREWGFAEAASRIGRLLRGEAPPTAPAPNDLPGYDAAASAILRLAFVLGGVRRDEGRTYVATRTLLVALIETAPLLTADQAQEALALRGMLRAGEEAAPYAMQRDAIFAIPADLDAAIAAAPPSAPPLSRNAQAVLDDARAFARGASASETVGVRHLLVALIARPDGTDRLAGAYETLRDAGADTDTMREALARIIAHRHPRDDQAAWRDLLIGRDIPRIAEAKPDTIPKDPRNDDKLDRGRYANALGALIAAEKQTPPLSIAVFGPWGSGKSFFMGMIRAAVNQFTSAGNKPVKTASPSPFLRRVVQIEFNAWHYAEGNLWASLLHAILQQLQAALVGDKGRTPFAEMLEKLKLQEAAKAEAEAKQKEAEQRLAEAKAALAKAEEQAKERGEHEAALRTTDVTGAVHALALRQFAPADGTDAKAWITSIAGNAQAAATYLGRPELAERFAPIAAVAADSAEAGKALDQQVGEIKGLLDEARANMARGRSLFTWLVHAPRSPWVACGWIVFAAAIFLLAFEAARHLAARGEEVAAAMSAIAGTLTPLLAMLAGAIGWARRHMSRATSAFGALGGLRERIEAERAQRLARHDAEVSAARRLAAEAEAEATRRRADVAAADVAVKSAKVDVAEATSPERLKRFVAQRLAQGDYQRQLGLIHTIRTDLEQLEKFLKTIHPQEQAYLEEARRAAPDSTAPPQADGAARLAETAQGTHVQRIVLYIDDLDRCPPPRVVEVLEAVHLLLAFRLFVVVVGVDVRWVAQALRERYPKQLGDAPGIASPLDYLEKVFQIPFWLPAMDAAGSRKLLDDAVGEAAVATTAPRDEGTEEESPVREALPTAGEPRASGAAPPPAPAADAAREADAESQDSIGTLTRAETRAVGEAIVLGETERQRLLDMAEAIGASPRRAKRFANLYRLMKASLSASERRGFVLNEGRAGSYDAALLLLAIATGAPRAASALIAALAEEPGEDAAGYLDACFSGVMAGVASGEKAAFVAAQRIAAGVTDKNAIVMHLRFWAPRVMRFAFDGQAAAPRAPEPRGEAR